MVIVALPLPLPLGATVVVGSAAFFVRVIVFNVGIGVVTVRGLVVVVFGAVVVGSAAFLVRIGVHVMGVRIHLGAVVGTLVVVLRSGIEGTRWAPTELAATTPPARVDRANTAAMTGRRFVMGSA